MFTAVLRKLAVRARQLRSFERLVSSDSGATAVEFALVAAPFLALLVGLFQTALVFLAGRELDEAVAQASRSIMTGQAQTSSMTQTQFNTAVCQNIYALFNCNNLMVNVQTYSSFSSANTSAPTLSYNAQGQVTNSWTYSPGGPGDIVVVQVMYQWPVVLGPLGFNLSNLANGDRLLMSTAAFKNEPY
jgi:Flp pilus assembly protein TadG